MKREITPWLWLAARAAAQGAATCALASTYATVNEKQLPDPWKFANGSAVTSAADWECRKQEISRIMQQFELGTLPPAPSDLTAKMSGSSIEVTIKVGSNTKTVSFAITKGNGPAIIGVGGTSVPVASGIGKITFDNNACAAQTNPQSHGTGWFFDLHGKSHSAGATLAWAWCVGRLIDGLELLGQNATGVDPKKLGVTGCSRNGKGAFIVGAFEPRIALTIPQESGSGGAACWRISDSEKSKGKNIQTGGQIVGENAWFSPNFNSVSSKTTTIPEDHHFLAALVAPRGLFVIENDIDWLGPVSTTGCMEAGRLIYNALGAANNFAFSLVGGHSHCSFPNASTADLTSYQQAFLLGQGKAAAINKSNFKPTMSDWVSSWRAAPSLAST